MDKKILIIGNWKCNPSTQKEVNHLLSVIKKGLTNKSKKTEIIICPPFVYLQNIIQSFKNSNFIMGAQNCFQEQKGAFTGEISCSMLKDLNCEYVIIGHSERRKYFKETDYIVNKKLKIALKSRLKPILCIGEETRDTFNSEGRPLNEMSLIVGDQLEKDLTGILSAHISEIVIAYEPIWAIGTGNSCSSDDAMKATLFIRKILTKLYNRSIADKANIVYGGSVTSKNAVDYINDASMDGLLIGRSSINGSEFIRIIEKINN